MSDSVKGPSRAIALLLLLIACPIAWDLHANGFAPGGGCDPGFGKRFRAAQERAIRSYFLEPLPGAIEVRSITCSGFTDSTLVATFQVSGTEARQLVADLEATFLARQDHPVVGESRKRRQMIGRPSHDTYVYHLPGRPLFDERTVSVSIPRETGEAATVVFEGGNF